MMQESIHQHNAIMQTPTTPEQIPTTVDDILTRAIERGASDVHFRPTAGDLEIRWRLDGVLSVMGSLPQQFAANVVARLKVLADLLTYQSDVPQEGRINQPGHSVELRVSTFPTIHGEKAVVRLFAPRHEFDRLSALGLHDEIQQQLAQLLGQTSGLILLCGPAGSGKTTTAYTMLKEIDHTAKGTRALVSLEDPVEASLTNVDQSPVRPQAGFTMATGLRSLVRQDPDVILVGEIRDPTTAETAFQASLTGHLVITTFHAGNSSRAISRLLDMDVEPYLLRSGLLAVLSQRLLRTLCECKTESNEPITFGDQTLTKHWQADGCEKCLQTGYRTRTLIAELLDPHWPNVGEAILNRYHAEHIETLARRAGMRSLSDAAFQLVAAGHTSLREAVRVLGSLQPTSGHTS